MAQPGFFDVENRFKKLDERDSLLRLGALTPAAYAKQLAMKADNINPGL